MGKALRGSDSVFIKSLLRTENRQFVVRLVSWMKVDLYFKEEVDLWSRGQSQWEVESQVQRTRTHTLKGTVWPHKFPVPSGAVWKKGETRVVDDVRSFAFEIDQLEEEM